MALHITRTWNRQGNTRALVLFNYAGASDSSLKDWEPINDFSIDYYVVNLNRDTQYGNFDEFIDISFIKVKEVIQHYEEVVLFGHSLGGLIAYELLSYASKHNISNNVSHLFISGTRPPMFIDANEISIVLEDNSHLANKLNQYGSRDMLNKINDISYEQEFLKRLREDLAIVSTYKHNKDNTLWIPATICYGNQDKLIPKKDILCWKQYLPDCEFAEFDGEHLFLHKYKYALIHKIENSFKETV